jgi:UDP-N-acetylglucosamine 2-epimerase (non-hydrolysing)
MVGYALPPAPSPPAPAVHTLTSPLPFPSSSSPPARVMVCFGTRPEVIKLAPVIAALREQAGVEPILVTTAQHREMLDQMLETFALVPDADLGLMRERQTLAELTGAAVPALAHTIEAHEPDALLVQGDTTTAFCGALAGFYADVPVGHVEAGLRTLDPRLPFPEEVNRRLVSVLARWHWCPTEINAQALMNEGVDPSAITITGNTVIDALLSIAGRPLPAALEAALPPKRAKRRILVTMHRRETQGAGQRELCRMLADVSARDDVEIVFPVHLSPAVRESVFGELAYAEHVHLVDPLDYHSFVHVLKSCDLVVTDSGGLQEEAPVFGIPVLVVRDTTERTEAVQAGVVRLSGTDAVAVRGDIEELLDDPAAYAAMAHAANPYGDGRAAGRIVTRLAADLRGGGEPDALLAETL